MCVLLNVTGQGRVKVFWIISKNENSFSWNTSIKWLLVLYLCNWVFLNLGSLLICDFFHITFARVFLPLEVGYPEMKSDASFLLNYSQYESVCVCEGLGDLLENIKHKLTQSEKAAKRQRSCRDLRLEWKNLLTRQLLWVIFHTFSHRKKWHDDSVCRKGW